MHIIISSHKFPSFRPNIEKTPCLIRRNNRNSTKTAFIGKSLSISCPSPPASAPTLYTFPSPPRPQTPNTPPLWPCRASNSENARYRGRSPRRWRAARVGRGGGRRYPGWRGGGGRRGSRRGEGQGWGEVWTWELGWRGRRWRY